MGNPKQHIVFEALARKYQAGDEEALRKLIKSFTPLLSARIYNYTHDRDSLKDISQECWAAIVPSLKSIEFKAGFEVWAFTIIRNKCSDWIRAQQKIRKQKSVFLESSEMSESESETEQGALSMMRKTIDELPHTQKMILNLFYKENLTLEEISKVLNISTGTVKSRLFYAREQLKEVINQSKQRG